MKEFPEISIITACYNCEKYLPDTINSVLSQDFPNWEWIICDDGSTDGSVEVLEKVNDSRIKILKNSTNQGAAVARNKALEKSIGRFITFLDSDDVWLPNFLSTVKNFLAAFNETVVYTSYKRTDENLVPVLDDFLAEDNITYKRLLENCPIPMLTAMYDSSKIGKVFIPLVDKREDHAMWLEVLKRAGKARAISESLGIYRMRKNSYSRNKLIIAKKQFCLYYYYLKLPLHQAVFYTLKWALNGLRKYGKI